MAHTIQNTETLFVYRSQESWYNLVTYLKDQNGKVKKIITGNIGQPTKKQKTYKLKDQIFALNWDNVPNLKN